ncbi:unnamed protein product [Adineta ricciae]|uniref:Transposase Tc1-like domain-containing protein n=1 Tax=Adineta ricciae TaxID=249248 RepID=A0A816FCN9_ADIRI|nr:unnamed protein product [Adineta ricciae]CAF1659137.1 unnamed protein product [Adineta ricciae]
MKSEDLQKLVLSKYENGESATKIFDDLLGAVSRKTVFNWCKMIRETGSINMSTSPGRPRTIRTKKTIQKIKTRLKRRKRVSSRKLAHELDISRTSVRRILTDDLGLRPCKKIIAPLMTDAQKAKRKTFANWIRTNFKKEDNENPVFRRENV